MKANLAVALVAPFVAALALAPTALAGGDEVFMENLSYAHIPVSGPALLIGNEGRFVCSAAGYGYAPVNIRWVVQQNHPAFTDTQADTFVRLAMESYCA